MTMIVTISVGLCHVYLSNSSFPSEEPPACKRYNPAFETSHETYKYLCDRKTAVGDTSKKSRENCLKSGILNEFQIKITQC